MHSTNEPIAVRLLGGFGLRTSAGWVTLTRPSARIVALLGLAGPRHRDDAAAMLWPDAASDRSHGYFRTALWRLNAAADGLVSVRGGQLELSPQVNVDARRLLDWAIGRMPEVPAGASPIDPDDLGRDLLPSWDDVWLDEHRERLRVLVPEALERRALSCLAQGATAEALWLALRAYQLDALRESAVRILIEGHLSQGNRAAALRVLSRHRAVLRTELGVDAAPDLLLLLGADAKASGTHGVQMSQQTQRQTRRRTIRTTGS